MGKLRESDEKVEVKAGLLGRGDSGGAVSQPISDTGEPFLTYGVASRMYLTGKGNSTHTFSLKYVTI